MNTQHEAPELQHNNKVRYNSDTLCGLDQRSQKTAH